MSLEFVARIKAKTPQLKICIDCSEFGCNFGPKDAEEHQESNPNYTNYQYELILYTLY